MTIELNKTEVELIDAALDVWEKQPHSEGMMSSMLGLMTRRAEGESKEQARETMKQELETATKETQQRRFKAILLRAKLVQALNKESEHDIA
jgi:hypothetical protein